MTWKLVDDGQTPSEVYNLRIYLTAILVASGGGVFGFTNSFFGSVLALPSFRSQFGLADLSSDALNNLSSNLAVCYQCGCFGACFIAYPFAETVGRRKALGIFASIFLLGAGLMLNARLGTFYAGRFLTGFGVGPITAIVPLYLAEIAPPTLRGRFIAFMEVFYQIGAVIGFWVGYGCSTTLSDTASAQWRIPVSIQIPLVTALLVGIPFIPETPRFLYKTGKLASAVSVVSRLRRLPEQHEYVQREVVLIREELETEREMMKLDADASTLTMLRKQLAECLKPGIRSRVSIGVITQLIGQFSGVNGLNYYSPRIFQSLGVRGNNTSLFATGIFGVVNLCTAFISGFFLVDRLGRRTLLLSGGVIMTFSLFYVGTYIKLADPDPSSTAGVNAAGVSALAFIYIYLIGFVSSYAFIPYILASELAPLNVRAMSATLGASAQWLGNLVITKATPYMISDMSYGTFYFFGSCVVLGSVYVYFMVDESRGLPMEELFTTDVKPHHDQIDSLPGEGNKGAVAYAEDIESKAVEH